MTMMLETMPFGSVETTDRVLTGMQEHENRVDNKIVYYDTKLTRKRAVVAHRAIGENQDLPVVVRDALPREFRAGASVWLGAGLAEDLFVSLVGYAMRDTVCGGDLHGGYVGVWCDCKLRGMARDWARDIAMRGAGIELA